MPNKPLQTVLAHLRDLAERSLATAALAPEARLREMRRLLNEYFQADPSILLLRARPEPVVAAGLPGEWLMAPASDPDCRLLYLHGGSWMKGGLDSHRTLAAWIADVSGASVLVVDYRLAPEHPFPAGLEDCLAAYAWMRDHGPRGRGAASEMWIAGDSAGGNLTLASLLALKQRGEELPEGAIALSAVTDFTASGESMRTRAERDPILKPDALAFCAKYYLQGRCDLKDPLASPLFGDLAGLPRLLLQVGEAETLLDDSRRFADAAREAEVPVQLSVWPDMPHVFQGFAPFLPQAVDALDEVARFVRRA
jgi:acetyl esterase/lipase